MIYPLATPTPMYAPGQAPRTNPTAIGDLFDRVVFVSEQPEGTSSTFVHGYLDGTFYLGTGHSASVFAENFDATIGNAIASGKAEIEVKNKLWELEGYLLYRKHNQ